MYPAHPTDNKKRSSIATGINIVIYILLLLSVGVTFLMMFVMTPRVQHINSVRSMAARSENQLQKIATITGKLAANDEATREAGHRDLDSEIAIFSDTLNNLSEQASISNPNAHFQLSQASTNWLTLRKALEKLSDTSTAISLQQQNDIEQRIKNIGSSLSEATGELSRQTENVSALANMLSTSVYILIIMLITWVLFLIRNITRRVHDLRETTQRIASGDYKARAIPTGNDELTELADNFNFMAEQIDNRLASERKARQQVESILTTLGETAERLALSASDILTATTEQAAAMSEEAAAVQEISVTVEELKQVTALSTQKANLVANLAQQSEEVTAHGRAAVERSVEGMLRIRQEVQSLASSMQRLSEQTQQVGEIISTVQDIAEQSNMLAVNAAIEAARAGEHGYGFSVVANEVRVLAEQSRQATVQIRSILGEIQKAVTTALSNTEAESKSVEDGVELVNQAGEVIRSLTDTISNSCDAANQIRASSDQHAAGVEQIALAITAIRDASVQALDNTHQTEQQAKLLRDLSFTLNDMLKENSSQNERDNLSIPAKKAPQGRV
ncbi:methyl-accepting chemotaxis protein [bacterium]|nr:methyl-accepting chemotaxis protein [bacterium]